MSELKFFLLMGVFTQNFNIVDLVKFLEKNQKLQIPIVGVTLKMTSYKTMGKKKSDKKWKTKILWGKQTSFLAFQPLGNSSHMAACRNSLENTRKKNLKPVLNKTLPQAHTESKFDVLGVSKKLVKYVIHLSKRKN
jgi:hypothetical protein